MKLSPVFWPAVKEPRNADAQRPFSGYAFQRKRSWVQLVRGHEARWFSFLPNSAPGKGLKIVGSVTAEGLVEVNGQIEGELHCTSLVIARGAHINGVVAAERVVVDGKVEGPIQGGEVILRSQAHVVGDIHHQSLAIERGAYFDGRSIQVRGANGHQPERVGHKRLKQVTNDSQEARTSHGRVDSLGSAENVAT